MSLPSRRRASGARPKAGRSRSPNERTNLLCAETSLLLVIDHQMKLLPSIDDGDQVLANAARLVEAAWLLNIPIVATEQTPEKIGPLTKDIRRYCSRILSKVHFDACADGAIDIIGHNQARKQIVISGCEAHVCVLQTAISLMRAGFSVWIVTSATGSHSQIDRSLAFERLRGLGATLVSLEMVLFEWLRRSDHPKFRELLQTIKSHRSRVIPDVQKH